MTKIRYPIEWTIFTADYLKVAIPEAIARAQENLDAVTAIPVDLCTFANVVEALESATEPLDYTWACASHLDTVTNGDELRAIYNEYLSEVTQFYGNIVLNEELWERVRAVYLCGFDGLTQIQRRLIEEIHLDFLENGANLPPEKKVRLREIKRDLARKTQKYSENVLDAMDKWEKIIPEENESILSGLPTTILKILRTNAEQKGHANAYRLTLQEVVYSPAMRYLESDDLRRELWSAYNTLGDGGPYNNGPLIGEILSLRREKAQLLGKNNFPDFILSRRMAKTGAAALSFTEDLHRKVLPHFLREIARLESFKRELDHNASGDRLEPWQLAYLSEKLCRKLHNFDREELRPFFPMDAVLSGLFQTLQRLYGITFQSLPITTEPHGNSNEIPVWHGDVRYYDVRESDGKLLGSFYLDLFPREGKRSGAWMEDSLRQGHLKNGEWIPPIGFVAANLTPPTGDQPSLLTHYEVETLFHEFGHLMHHLMGKVNYASLNGCNVALDFVELPSQILENWVWELEALNLFAHHYESQNPMPLELFQKMLSARNHLIAIVIMRQLALQKMDLELHISYVDGDLDEFIDGATALYAVPYATKPLSIVRHFNHLFSGPTGYAAAYYSYKWAEVLDADAFTRFRNEGIFNEAVARNFRQEILARGNSEFPDVFYHGFMGREPSLDAFLHRYGLDANPVESC